MKKSILISAFFIVNICVCQSVDIFSENYISQRIQQANDQALIKATYTDDFKRILEQFTSKSWFPYTASMTDYYFPLFEAKLAKHGVPSDLKYIAVIESALKPRATSEMGAKGLWQFMPGTGALQGLAASDEIDLYYDVVANTDSAVRYLKELYQRYGDWKFAICAYNYGFGNVDKKIKRAETTEFNKVYRLFPKETKEYLKRFMVIKFLVENRDAYFPDRKYFKHRFSDLKQVRIAQRTTIKKLADHYKTSVRFIRFANPQLLKTTIPKGTMVYVKDQSILLSKNK